MTGGALAGLTIAWPGFTKALAGLIGAVAAGNWVSAVEKAADVVGAVGRAKPTTAELAVRLVGTALAVAVAKTLATTAAGRRLPPQTMAGFAAQALQTALPEFRFDKPFLANASSSKLAEDAKMQLFMVLTGQGEQPDAAFRAANDFPAMLTEALATEWQRDRERYAPLEKLAATPFDADLARQEAWAAYLGTLEAEVEQELREIEARRPSDSKVSLASVYEPLWGRTLPDEALLAEVRAAREHTGTGLNPLPGSGSSMLLELDAELDDWLAGRSRCKERLRVLAGGPGSGKSSVAKMLAARRAHLGEPTLFVPIHRLDLTGSAQAAIEAFARGVGLDGFVLDDPAGPRQLLVILDGLDEIAMQGQAARDKAREVVIELARLVDRAELRVRGVRVLVGGRELVVQDAAASLKAPGQVIHLVGYAPARAGIGEKPDQRDTWWARYGRLKGQGWVAMPAWLRGKDGAPTARAVEEITDQPMLNFLLAQAMAHGVIPPHEQPELAALYDRLLRAVYQRPWGEAGVRPGLLGEAGQAATPVPMAFEDFDELLQAIALAAWHGSGRAVPEREALRYAAASNLGAVVQRMQAGATASGLHGFMVAFYARRGGATDGEPSFEFTHKSFAEYLAARRLVREVLHAVRQRRAEEAARNSGWSEDVALQHLMAHFGPKALDADLLRFVPGEIDRQLAGGTLDHAGLHAALVALINRSLHQGVAADPRFAALAGRNAEARSLANLELSLFLLRGIAAEACGAVSAIRWPSRTAAGDWIRFSLQNKGSIHDPSFARVRFEGQDISGLDLFAMTFDDAEFVGCLLEHCAFDFCGMTSVTFRGGSINNSRFHGCHLSHAIFQDVALGFAPDDMARFVFADSEMRVAGAASDQPERTAPASTVAWNVVGEKVHFSSGDPINAALETHPWRPPASVVLRAKLDHVRFTNCMMVGVQVRDEAWPLSGTMAVERVHLAFCDVADGGPLAEAARRPVLPVGRGLWFDLPDEMGAQADPPDANHPLPPGEGGAEGAA